MSTQKPEILGCITKNEAKRRMLKEKEETEERN
jgi:hypothetical protein